MKILMISSYLPYPLHSGGHIRLYNLMKQLAKKHEIVLICEKRDYQTEKDIQEVKKVCKLVIAVPRRHQWSLQNIVRTGFSTNPFLITGHTNNVMQEKITALLQIEQFDLIHVETSYVMQNLPITGVPVVLVEHNIEYLVYKRFAGNAPFFLRPLLALDVVKLKRVEEAFWRKATHVVAVSEIEKRKMGIHNVTVVPNGVDIEKFKSQISNLKSQKSEKKILFIGDFKWMQNRDTARWIIEEIWPEVNKKLETENKKQDIKLWIVGRKIPGAVKALGKDDSIIFDEDNPKPTDEIFAEADVLLAPIRVGGGTSYKILEAMAVGTPVITTPLGIEGIKVEERKDVLTGNNAKELAEQVVGVLHDEKKYQSIARNARKKIEENYDWKIIAKELEKVYEAVAKKKE